MLGSQLVLQEASAARKQNGAEGPEAQRPARSRGLRQHWRSGGDLAGQGLGGERREREAHLRTTSEQTQQDSVADEQGSRDECSCDGLDVAP